MRRWLALVLAGVGASTGVGSTIHLYGWSNLGFWIGDALAGLALLACGVCVVLMVRHRGIGWLLIAAGWAWFVPSLALMGSASSGVAIGALLLLHRGVLSHAFLTYPRGRIEGRTSRSLVVAGYLVSIVPGVWSSPSVTAVSCLVMLGLQGVMLAGEGWTSAGRLGSATAFLFWCVVAGLSLLRSTVRPANLPNGLLIAYEVTVAATGLVLALGVVVESRRRTGVADLVVELGGVRSGSLEARLALALDDPLLKVGYWVPDMGRFVDARGKPLEVGEDGDRVRTVVRGSDATPIAVLAHDPRLPVDPHLTEALGLATSLSAQHARLQAQLRNSLVETNESRRRLLTAADDERDRLAARLRAGAQTTLDALGRALELARGEAINPTTREQVAASADQLARTDTELTRLARGVSPRRVVEEGLDDALVGMARECGLPAFLRVAPVDAPLEVRECLYFVCSEALANVVKHAPGSTVTLSLQQSAADVILEVDDDGPGGASVEAGSGLTGLRDRVETLGGKLTVLSPQGAGTHLTATIPIGRRQE